MPVKLVDPTLKVLFSGKKLITHDLPNPGRKITFEGTQQEVIEWLRDKGPELTEKAIRREIDEVEIVRHVQGKVAVSWINLKEIPEEKLRDVFAESLNKEVGGLLTDKAIDFILKKKKLIEGGAVYTGVDRELGIMHVYTEHPKIGKEITLRYEPHIIGPVEKTIRFKRTSGG